MKNTETLKAEKLKPAAAPDEIDEQLNHWRARKKKLEEVIALQEECVNLELRLMLGKRDAVVVSRTVAEIVCEHFKISSAMLASRCRQEHIAWPRHITFYLIRQFSAETLSAIGRIFDRDHGTVLHALEHVVDRMSVEPATKAQIESLEAECKQRLANTNAETLKSEKLKSDVSVSGCQPVSLSK